MLENKSRTIALIIPTFNAEKDIPFLFPAILRQTLKPDQILVIDSSSSDQTRNLLLQYPVQVHTIPTNEFDHGGTRKLATNLVTADIYIFLTQDAYPADEHAFKNLVDTLVSQEKIACVYGRQLAKKDATPLSTHGRLFNYPENSYVRRFEDRHRFGIKTCFNSDSFAAYKKAPLSLVGNFPSNLISCEDVYIAAKLVKSGYLCAYSANARVFHSHNLSLRDEFHRYFSIGVFHSRDKWILNDFSSATGEGLRFIKSEFIYLFKNKKYLWIIRAFLSTFVKYFGYKLGFYEKHIPLFIKKGLGVNKSFWLKNNVLGLT